jgi:2-polyprenyl-6-methoxyphenol hydroxylase-like FAD-dependent oxidoreductase
MEGLYDVMICGAGPTGVLLAAYLSRAGGVKVREN